jgi:hypothetical protein
VPVDYVPRVREVMGPSRKLYEWWPADQKGKALSVSQAFWLRRLPHNRHTCPGIVQRGLARRGLWAPSGLTDAGKDMQATLGTLPDVLLRVRWRTQEDHVRARYPDPRSVSLGPLETPVQCACGRSVPAELYAWGASMCLACARKDTA